MKKIKEVLGMIFSGLCAVMMAAVMVMSAPKNKKKDD